MSAADDAYVERLLAQAERAEALVEALQARIDHLEDTATCPFDCSACREEP